MNVSYNVAKPTLTDVVDSRFYEMIDRTYKFLLFFV